MSDSQDRQSLDRRESLPDSRDPIQQDLHPEGENGQGDGTGEQPELSLIIPAYNELRRLPPYLRTIQKYLNERYDSRYEVIVVDDGSADDLSNGLQADFGSWPQLRVMRHAENQGKGAAVRTGMLAAQGRRLLFADADGATPITEEAKLAAALKMGGELAVGSRLVAADEVVRQRTWQRALVGRLFAAVARLLLPVGVRDTQCGFKMFLRSQGQLLFRFSRESGYLFDLEVLALATRCGYCVVEVPINWSERPGSRLHLSRDGWRILADLWQLRRRVKRLPVDYDKRIQAQEAGTTKA